MPLPNVGRVHAGLPLVTLVLGGARSGKSRYAECLIEGAAACGTYCATAEAGDAEMAQRIAAHRARRGSFWHTIEEPLALASVIAAEASPARPLLIDCLTLWLSNLMLAERPIEGETAALCAALRLAAGPVVLVANEVGMGLVPGDAARPPLSRRRRPPQSADRRPGRPRRLRRRRSAAGVEGGLIGCAASRRR